MYESAAEVRALDELLDRSLAGSTEHLRSIFRPGRTLNGEQLLRALDGMRTLSVATVTARGEPRISAADGHLLHSRFVFTTGRDAAKARHLRARPGVSVAHVAGDSLGVFAHGRAQFLTPAHADFDEIEEHLVGHYGSSPSSWGDVVYIRVQPDWMVGYAFRPDEPAAGD